MQVIEEIVKIREKGQINLPAKIQERADLKGGIF
jgi:bifunctional DNA-binding transcriptional regulator/antitoxin component of YhaV-PrlF toxin-antitoxin module